MADYHLAGASRVVTTLRAIARLSEPSITELVADLGFGKATTFRIVSTLRDEGLVVQDAATRRYRLGLEMAVLGRAALNDYDLQRDLTPTLERIQREVSLPIFLNVPSAADVLCLDHFAGTSILSMFGRTGITMPYHACPSGLVLLAFGPDERLDHIASGPLGRMASRTITDPEALRTQVARVREARIAFGEDDLEDGMSSLSVPIFDIHDSVVAAIGIAGPSAVVAERRSRIVAILEKVRDAELVGSQRTPVPPAGPQRRS